MIPKLGYPSGRSAGAVVKGFVRLTNKGRLSSLATHPSWWADPPSVTLVGRPRSSATSLGARGQPIPLVGLVRAYNVYCGGLKRVDVLLRVNA